MGLIGEPFEIETTSKFDKATLTYVIDKSKLGDTEFDNLLFLWYDEENDNFVELDTMLDEENSTVSVETTHFSKYMIVNREEWYKAWSTELYPSYYDYAPSGLSTVWSLIVRVVCNTTIHMKQAEKRQLNRLLMF